MKQPQHAVPRLPPSMVKSLPGDLGNTWKRRERTVIGASNRAAHAEIKVVRESSQPEDVKKVTMRQNQLLDTQQHFEDTTMKKGESLKNQIKKKQDDALEVKPAAPKDYWTDSGKLRAADKTVTKAIKEGGVTQTKHQDRERGPPCHIPTGEGPAPEFPEPIKPATRLGKSVYPETLSLTQPTPDCPGYAAPEEQFRTGVLDKFDCHQATQLKHVRDDFRLNRRRNNYARVLQAYADEEAEKGDALDEFASKSMTLQSVGSVGSQPSPRSESQRSSQHSQSSQRTTGSRSRMAELVQGSASPFPGDSTRLQSTVGPSPMAALIG